MKTTLLALLLTTAISGCSWFESLKPKEIFYCKVNGNKFRPDKDSSPVGGIGTDPLRVSFDKENGYFSILVRNAPNSISIYLNLKRNEPLKIQEVVLTSDINNSKAYFTSDYAETNKEQLISDSGVFKITKIDAQNLSGTFEFTCKSAKTGKVFKITEGEFNDISYY